MPSGLDVPKVKKVTVPKHWRDMAAYLEKTGGEILPAPDSPICRKCGLDKRGSLNPYLTPVGADQPLITFVYEGPGRAEDKAGKLGVDGVPSFIYRQAVKAAAEYGVDPARFRFSPITRCAIIAEGKGKVETGGKSCISHLMVDIKDHRPSLIVPIGSKVLGLLNYKSNAQDWSGKLLTFRGWPDDWLIDPKLRDRHPLFGAPPGIDQHIPLMPLLNPRQVYGTKNPAAINNWHLHLKRVMALAANGAPAMTYDRPWWKLTDDPNEVADAMREIIELQGVVTYDTETTGLHPFLQDKIVFMMMRWVGRDGQPRALGWPWDFHGSEPGAVLQFDASAMLPYLEQLAPLILKALSVSKLRGHNLTFDLMFTIATLPGGLEWLDRLCEAFSEDTWHMRYTLRQERGSIGLDILAYDWAPTLAGYEEAMSLIIEQLPELLKPNDGGHYARCPKKYWQTHFRPYVMGDVEVCHEAADKLLEQLTKTKEYEIPLASPINLGKFRRYKAINRLDVYRRVISPAASILAKMTARGMHIDQEELSRQEDMFPKRIKNATATLRASDDRLNRWCTLNESLDPAWAFDLNKPAILKEALFDVMNLPVKSVTDAGERALGRNLDRATRDQLRPFASTDKFSLNSLAVDHPQVRSLLEYRSLAKQYSSYVRPLRNYFCPGVDKKPLDKPTVMGPDSRVHSSFKITGTRTGRLSSCVDGGTKIPVMIIVPGKDAVLAHPTIADLDLEDPRYPNAQYLVFTHKRCYRRVLEKYVSPPVEMFEVTTDYGSKITCTGGHRFLTPGGWRHLRDLKVGDRIDGVGKDAVIKKIASVGPREVYDIHVAVDNSYCAEGFVNHNSNPNLQQIPRDGVIKRLYTSRFGERGCIYQADLSQIELRLLAAACGDPRMVEAYRNGVDLHSLTTSSVFKLPYEHFSKDYAQWLQANGRSAEVKQLEGKRKMGKTLNFLTGYGGGAYGFQSALALQGVYVGLEECERHLAAFFDAYPYLKIHIGHYKRFVQEFGRAVSITGRVRILDEVRSDDPGIANKALRAGYNHLIQSTASDAMLLCLVAIEHLMRQAGLESILVSTVHDSLVIDAIRKEIPAIHAIVDEVLSNIPEVMQLCIGPQFDISWAIVPFSGDAEYGSSYYQAVKIPVSKSIDWDKLDIVAFAA